MDFKLIVPIIVGGVKFSWGRKRKRQRRQICWQREAAPGEVSHSLKINNRMCHDFDTPFIMYFLCGLLYIKSNLGTHYDLNFHPKWLFVQIYFNLSKRFFLFRKMLDCSILVNKTQKSKLKTKVKHPSPGSKKKGNKSLVENFYFYFLTLFFENFKMLHFDANPITIGYLVTELWRIWQR